MMAMLLSPILPQEIEEFLLFGLTLQLFSPLSSDKQTRLLDAFLASDDNGFVHRFCEHLPPPPLGPDYPSWHSAYRDPYSASGADLLAALQASPWAVSHQRVESHRAQLLAVDPTWETVREEIFGPSPEPEVVLDADGDYDIVGLDDDEAAYRAAQGHELWYALGGVYTLADLRAGRDVADFIRRHQSRQEALSGEDEGEDEDADAEADADEAEAAVEAQAASEAAFEEFWRLCSSPVPDVRQGPAYLELWTSQAWTDVLEKIDVWMHCGPAAALALARWVMRLDCNRVFDIPGSTGATASGRDAAATAGRVLRSLVEPLREQAAGTTDARRRERRERRQRREERQRQQRQWQRQLGLNVAMSHFAPEIQKMFSALGTAVSACGMEANGPAWALLLHLESQAARKESMASDVQTPYRESH